MKALSYLCGAALFAQKLRKGDPQMKKSNAHISLVTIIAIVTLLLNTVVVNAADTAIQIDREVDSAIKSLYTTSSAAEELSKIAKGVLIFPKVTKAGLLIGGQYGEGALRVDDKTVGYYKTTAASYGIQAGVQTFGYAMFFMSDTELQNLKKSSGWEVGVGPSIVVVDEGFTLPFTTTTAKEDIYVFFFDQNGLMAGLGLQGSKLTQIHPDK
jgi:lipid-binding SYLF domain-containing protein